MATPSLMISIKRALLHGHPSLLISIKRALLHVHPYLLISIKRALLHGHPSLLISIKRAAYQKDGAGDITNVAYLNKYSFYSPSCTLATLLLNIL